MPNECAVSDLCRSACSSNVESIKDCSDATVDGSSSEPGKFDVCSYHRPVEAAKGQRHLSEVSADETIETDRRPVDTQDRLDRCRDVFRPDLAPPWPSGLGRQESGLPAKGIGRPDDGFPTSMHATESGWLASRLRTGAFFQASLRAG